MVWSLETQKEQRSGSGVQEVSQRREDCAGLSGSMTLISCAIQGSICSDWGIRVILSGEESRSIL